MVKVEFRDFGVATVRKGRWFSGVEILQDLLNTLVREENLSISELYESPDLDRALAFSATRQFPGKILEVSPVRSVPGRIY